MHQDVSAACQARYNALDLAALSIEYASLKIKSNLGEDHHRAPNNSTAKEIIGPSKCILLTMHAQPDHDKHDS